jgi:hypothetical protein
MHTYHNVTFLEFIIRYSIWYHLNYKKSLLGALKVIQLIVIN